MLKRWLARVCTFVVILGAWKGYIALVDKGASEPRQIFPTMIASLPPADQAALESGIIVRNDRDLNQLLEDYLS